MWSKTRKALYERLAPTLSSRITYEVQNYQHLKCDCQMCADNRKQFIITIDKSAYTIGGAGAFFQDEIRKKVFQELKLRRGDVEYCHNYPEGIDEQNVVNGMFYHTGIMPFSYTMSRIHLFLNCVDIEECLSGTDYFLFLLAVLDRRVGKRRIQKIYQGIESESEWIRKFIRLRAEAEGIANKTEY